MGNYRRIRLTDIIPNSWFRFMGTSKKLRPKPNTTASPPSINKRHAVPSSPLRTPRSPTSSRTSYYYSRSSPKRLASAVSSSCSCRAKSWSRTSHSPGLPDFCTTSGDSSLTAATFSPDFRSDHFLLPDDDNNASYPSPCSCTSKPPVAAAKSSQLDLRPIKTKSPAKKQGTEPRKLSGRKTTSPGVRLRLNSPRVSVSGGRRSGAASRRSMAVVKVSADPGRDFKESMVEMIVENNIRGSKDLEELLACYLYLNSDEYHHVIITAFKQIWLQLNSS